MRNYRHADYLGRSKRREKAPSKGPGHLRSALGDTQRFGKRGGAAAREEALHDGARVRAGGAAKGVSERKEKE